jgi:hypothetical protein
VVKKGIKVFPFKPCYNRACNAGDLQWWRVLD